jgi:hypothetical protein
MIISAKYWNQFYNSKNRGNHTAGFSVAGQKIPRDVAAPAVPLSFPAGQKK